VIIHKARIPPAMFPTAVRTKTAVRTVTTATVAIAETTDLEAPDSNDVSGRLPTPSGCQRDIQCSP